MVHLLRFYRDFQEKLWKTRARDLPALKRHPLKFLKVLLLAARSFRNDNESVRAAALTLYTLLSIVPVTALLFGIAKGFGLDIRLEEWLLAQFPDQQDMLVQVVSLSRKALDTVESGFIAGAGVVFLIYSVVKVIGNIEQAFNRIWSQAKPRTWVRQFSDYLSIVLVGPFLALGVSSLNVYVATLLRSAADAAPFGRIAGPAVGFGLQAAPLLLLWLLFTFLYVFVPNTKVRIAPALVGGALAAILYQVVQTLYIGLQVGVSRTNAIYGSFAALPLFLIWLHLSWRIVLFGADITHQFQNFESNERVERIPDLSFRAVKRLALALADRICASFLKGEPPPTAESLAAGLGIPNAVMADLLDRLVKAHLIVEVAQADPHEPGYLPARDPHLLTPATVVEALEASGEDLDNAGAGAASGEDHPINRPLGTSGTEGSWSSRH